MAIKKKYVGCVEHGQFLIVQKNPESFEGKRPTKPIFAVLRDSAILSMQATVARSLINT
jgi:hypothetical protein